MRYSASALLFMVLLLYVGSANALTQISDCMQLQDMKNSLAEDYILVNDIDCSATSTWNGGQGFEPIGDALENIRFTGSLDGQCHTISGLHINRPSTTHVGLIGYGVGASIQNVVIANADITGAGSTGALAGRLEFSNVSNCSSSGQVSGTYAAVGGLIGYATYETSPAVDGSTVNGSFSSATVHSGHWEAGGLIGSLVGEVSDSYAIGDVEAIGRNVGGLVARTFFPSKVSNSYATGNVTAGTSFAGGLVGNFQGTIENSYSTGAVSGSSNTGGLVGVKNGTILLSYWNNHAANPSSCYSGGDSGCTAIADDEAFFFDSANAPMSAWSLAAWAFDGLGHATLEWLECAPSPVAVSIDIKPGSSPNSINLNSGGATPAAILGSADFDVNDVDWDTLSLGTSGIKTVGRFDKMLCSNDDVSGDFTAGPEGEPDGFLDLVCHFITIDIVPEEGGTTATLNGALNDGTPIEGTDSVNIVS